MASARGFLDIAFTVGEQREQRVEDLGAQGLLAAVEVTRREVKGRHTLDARAPRDSRRLAGVDVVAADEGPVSISDSMVGSRDEPEPTDVALAK